MPNTPEERNQLVLLRNRRREKSTEISTIVRIKRETRNRYAHLIRNTNDRNQKAFYRTTRDIEINRYDMQNDAKKQEKTVLTNQINTILQRGRARR
ncbi:MAG: hypothetical protein Q7U54_09610 [Bacteroidales bacterium]|nr:hypothetical protein [Bacteroidales bacterium]